MPTEMHEYMYTIIIILRPLSRWMGRCVIDRPVKEVVDFIQDLGNRKYWDKYLEVSI